MTDLATTAPAFVEMAHRIAWCGVATVDPRGRPRTRIMHPIWEWDGARLRGWIATSQTPVKLAHLEQSPYVSCSYWTPDHDTCVAECRAEWALDDETCIETWERYKNGPPPVGYDPATIPPWAGGPTSDAFAVLTLEPWRLRVLPGSLMLEGRGDLLSWRAEGE